MSALWVNLEISNFNSHGNRVFCGIVFQNTYTNAAKLLEAARHLASSGECNPEEIQKRVDYFEKRVQEFINRVNRRKSLLKLAVNFYSRTQKVRSAWDDAYFKFGVNYRTVLQEAG